MTRPQLTEALLSLGHPQAEALDAVDEVTKLYEFMGEGVMVGGQTPLGELTIMLGPENESNPAPIYALTLK